MAQVVDLWHKKDRTRSGRYGIGKRWQAIYHDQAGQRHKESFVTKDEAEAFLADQMTAINTGTHVSKAQRAVTFGDLWPRFELIKSKTAKKTQEMYAGAWNLYVKDRWETEFVREVRSPAVAEWLAGLKTTRGKARGISESYEHKILLLMKSLCELAVDDGVLTKNPLKKSKARTQPASERRYLTVAQADDLVSAIEPHSLMVRVMLQTGMRRGEAAGLKVADFDKRRARLRIHRDIDETGKEDATKSGRHRDVPVRGLLLEDLGKLVKGRGRDEYLMPDLKGRPWTKHTWRPVWEKVRGKSGIADLDTHELRHTAVSWAIHAGANIKTVQRMVGHASASMTLDVYGHLWDDQLDEVAQKMDAFMEEERARAKREEDEEKSAALILPEPVAHGLPTAKSKTA